MTLTEQKRDLFLYRRSTFLAFGLLLGLSLFGCSRSPWVKTDEHEVSATEHLECAQEVQQNRKGEELDQKVIEKRIEQCMIDKGYHRRPWWLLNDLHWQVRQPIY
jgi:hypothetical protein